MDIRQKDVSYVFFFGFRSYDKKYSINTAFLQQKNHTNSQDLVIQSLIQ